jgi:hypothetical protein
MGVSKMTDMEKFISIVKGLAMITRIMTDIHPEVWDIMKKDYPEVLLMSHLIHKGESNAAY